MAEIRQHIATVCGEMFFYMGLISWRVWFVFPVECLRQTGCNSKHQTALFQAGSTDSRGRAAAMVSRGSATMYC